jgi:purine-binding chemotaxis protein CheW
METRGGKFLTFLLGKENYGIPLKQVKEIIGMLEITHIPKAKGYIKGVLNLRGKIIPIMDLRLKLGMDEKPYTDRTCIIVIEVNFNDNQRLMGLIVDVVTEVLKFQNNEIEALGYDAQIEDDLLMGLGKLNDKIVLIIDIEKLLNKDDSVILKEAEPEDDTHVMMHKPEISLK